MVKKKPHPASIRNTKTTTVKDAMSAMLESYNLNRRFDQTSVISAWPKIMGKAVANRTSNLEIRNDVLVVTLSSAPLKQELNNSRSKVLELIHKEFGRAVVKDVLFV